MKAWIPRLVIAACIAFGFGVALPGSALAQKSAQRSVLPPPGADIQYVARDRDTMIGIARRYLIEGQLNEVQRALWDHNQLKDKDAIRAGQIIRIPRNWLRDAAGGIELAHVEGDVQSKGQPLRAGTRLSPGDDFRTGKDGYVTLKLADGSTLVLQPGSDMLIDDVRKSPLESSADARFTLKSGRVEAAVQKRSPTGGRFEVRTPIAVAAVRGTKFRVTADSEKRTATSEVLEGIVQVNDSGNLGSVSVQEGFGTRVEEGSAPATPRALLPAPRLWTGIRLSLRKPVRLNFTQLAGAVSYRVLLTREGDFRNVISDTVLASNEIILPDLENGPYFLKVRGIDAIGLEGRDTTADLVLSIPATAPAPAPLAPAPSDPAPSDPAPSDPAPSDSAPLAPAPGRSP